MNHRKAGADVSSVRIRYFRQALVLFFGSLIFATGMTTGWAAPANPVTTKGESKMKDQGIREYEAIRQTVNLYIQAGLKGKSSIMKPAFHSDAIMYGHTGGQLPGGPIQSLFDIIDANPPAKDLKGEITAIEIVEKIAYVRVESENWNGARYSDMFLLLKDGKDWKILTKIFYHHE